MKRKTIKKEKVKFTVRVDPKKLARANKMRKAKWGDLLDAFLDMVASGQTIGGQSAHTSAEILS